MTGNPSSAGSENPDRLARRLTFQIAIAGISAVLLAFALAVVVFHDAENPGELIPAILGSVTGAIGTLAGLVAGHTAGAAGKERAEQRATANEEQAAAGLALAHSVVTDGPAAVPAAADVESFGSTPAGDQGEEIARRHAELARRLFPGLDDG